MDVSTRELRTETKRVLDAVEGGEEVVITRRGKLRARIVPVEADRASAWDSPLFGRWKDREDMADVQAGLRKIRRGRRDRLPFAINGSDGDDNRT